MNGITPCLKAMIPPELIIPILPWDAEHKSKGKVPAILGPDGKSWSFLKGWQKGVSLEVLDQHVKTDANAGLRLGIPVETGRIHLAALDIDLEEGQEAHRDKIIEGLKYNWDCNIQIRETVPYRGLVLVNIDDINSSQKIVFTLSYYGESIGKLEALTTGQQAVVAGTHWSGKTIRWVHFNKPSEVAYAPNLIDAPKRFAIYEDFINSVTDVIKNLGEGYTYDISYAGGDRNGALIPPAQRVPQHLTPKLVVDLLDQMPNPFLVDYNAWLNVMFSVDGCIQGMEARRGGPLDENVLASIANSVAEWTARWENVKDRCSYREALAKWEANVRGQCRNLGWHNLLNYARDFGSETALISQIAGQAEFRPQARPAGEPQPEPEPEPEVDPLEEIRKAKEKRQRWIGELRIQPGEAADIEEAPNSETSDFTIGKYVQAKIGHNLIYVPGTKSWFVWDYHQNGAGWEGGEQHEKVVSKEIHRQLTAYTVEHDKLVAKRGGKGAWTKREIDGVNSTRRKNAVLDYLSIHRAVSSSEINQSYGYIQTPQSMISLMEDRRTSRLERKKMFDVRYTGVEPEPGPTPRFDDVLMHLSDGNEEVQQWIWHYLGYSLLGMPKEQVFVMIWGPGENGKSVLTTTMKNLLGGYAVALNANVLLESGKGMHPTSLYQVRFKRSIVVSELPKDIKWNERSLKMLSGGDYIEAREMNQNPVHFKSEGAMLMVTNHIPVFTSVNRSIVRRFRLIGTTRLVANPDKTLEEYLLNIEGPAILHRMIEYARMVYANGVALPEVPAVMKAEADEHLSVGDPVFAWLNEECNFGAGFFDCYTPMAELKNRFESWIKRRAKEYGEPASAGEFMPIVLFRKKLKGAGIISMEAGGAPLRKAMNRTSQTGREAIHVARGVELKVKGAINLDDVSAFN